MKLIKIGMLLLLCTALTACTSNKEVKAPQSVLADQAGQNNQATAEPLADQPKNAAKAENGSNKGGQYAGTIDKGQNFKLTLSDDGRQITEVSADVLEYCDGSSSSSWTTLYLEGPFEVNADGTFATDGTEKYEDLTLTYSFSGAFDASDKANGTISQDTVILGSVCRTFDLNWEAEKQ